MDALRQVGRGLGIGLLLLAGCLTSPVVEGLDVVPPGTVIVEQNPLWIALGHSHYPLVWENVLRVLADMGFEIAEANRFDGRIETLPRISAGCGLPLKPGSPDPHERLLSTLQTYRHRVSIQILPADDPNGGYFINVIVRRELEDLPRPSRATAGAALFRSENNVERTFEVIDPTVFESHWIPKGRDPALEQAILRRLHECMPG